MGFENFSRDLVLLVEYYQNFRSAAQAAAIWNAQCSEEDGDTANEISDRQARRVIEEMRIDAQSGSGIMRTEWDEYKGWLEWGIFWAMLKPEEFDKLRERLATGYAELARKKAYEETWQWADRVRLRALHLVPQDKRQTLLYKPDTPTK